jgi:hypothetical protein
MFVHPMQMHLQRLQAVLASHVAELPGFSLSMLTSMNSSGECMAQHLLLSCSTSAASRPAASSVTCAAESNSCWHVA